MQPLLLTLKGFRGIRAGLGLDALTLDFERNADGAQLVAIAGANGRGKTPVIQRPGQRQSISAASAVNAKGGFWFATYQGALNAELFIELLKKLMKGRSKPVHLVVDGLPAHKKANVREYIASTRGKLSMHVLPGYAPDLNPDELVWSYVKRTGVARNPLRAGEKLELRIEKQLHDVQRNRRLVRSFFGTPSVAYISDC